MVTVFGQPDIGEAEADECTVCGALVLNPDKHAEWHHHQSERISDALRSAASTRFVQGLPL